MITSNAGPDVVPARLGSPSFGRDKSHTKHARQIANANAKIISDIFRSLCISFPRSPQILASVKRFGRFHRLRSLGRNQRSKLRERSVPERGSVG